MSWVHSCPAVRAGVFRASFSVFVLWKHEMFASAHDRDEYLSAAAMKSINCCPSLWYLRNCPVASLINTRETISASQKIPTGVLANMDSTTATQEPSRRERMSDVFARQNASSTVAFGAFTSNSNR